MMSFFKKIFRSDKVRKNTRTLGVEGLSERIVPAFATFNGAVSAAWSTAANWTWTDNSLANNYPGDDVNRAGDQVIFDQNSPSCTLSNDLSSPLKNINVNNNFSHTITLGGDVSAISGH